MSDGPPSSIKRIGLFDSGFGGLTVLRAVADGLPDSALVYLGDHARAPYGGRAPDEIYALTIEAVERLFAKGCDLVLLACNTASAVALRRLQQEWLPRTFPERRVLGVLVPMVEAITRQPWQLEGPPRGPLDPPKVVAVFATRRTVDSGAYPREIGKRAPNVEVVQQACPQLAARIEAGAPASIIQPMIRDSVAALRRQIQGVVPDVVVLGCTHYPLVAETFAKSLPPAAQLLDQPSLVAASLGAYLQRHPEFAVARPGGGGIEFLTTGDPDRTSVLGSRFFGRDIRFTLERDAA